MELQVNVVPISSDSPIKILEDASLILANVSNIKQVTSGHFSGSSGFQLSSDTTTLSRLNGNTLFGISGYPGILSREMSDANGNINVKVVMILENTTFTNMCIGFDNVTREHAVNFMLSSNTKSGVISINNNKKTLVYVDIQSIVDNTKENTLTLTITKWSKPNASVRITLLGQRFLQLTANDLISVEWSEKMLDDNMEQAPGMCEQFADIQFYDRTDSMIKLIEQDQLVNNYTVEILIDNVLVNTYLVIDWDCDTNNSTYTLKCADFYSKFENIELPAQSVKDRTVYNWLSIVFDAAGVTWSSSGIGSETWKIVTLPNSWSSIGTLGSLLQKICSAYGLRVYWLRGEYIVRSLWYE